MKALIKKKTTIFTITNNNDYKPFILQKKKQHKITFKTTQLYEILKDINSVSSYTQIIAKKKIILFKGSGNEGDISIVHDNVEYNKKEILYGFFEIKNLLIFSNCTKLCENINVYLGIDFPMLLEIKVKDFGQLNIYITPIDITERNKQDG